MQLGIFAKTFARAAFAETLDAIVAQGLHSIQFNFACVGLRSLPDTIPSELCERIGRECASRSVVVAGVSGTFNMIHPEPAVRAAGLRRLEVLAPATRALGCDFISLCTGTRDPDDMWRAHPENISPAAWRDLLRSMEQAMAVAERHDVLLGVEPEVGNVISSARKARQLLDELHSSRVKIVIDPANLFHPGPVEHMRGTIQEAFQLVGTDIVMAHAKELAADGTTGNVVPGKGVLDWDYYFNTLAGMNFSGPIVLHGVGESDVPEAARFLRAKLWE